MPRFKNTGLVPVQTPLGAPVAPGGFCEYDGKPVPGLVEVPAAPAAPNLEDLTVDQLRDVAATDGIDLAGATRKGEVIAAITAHREATS